MWLFGSHSEMFCSRISRLMHYNSNQAFTGLHFLQQWLMNPQQSKTSILYACLCDSNRFSVTLMENHYTFMHIRHHTCPIHLLANLNLFLFAWTCFQLEEIYITHPVFTGYLQREGRRTEANAWRYSREWNRQKSRGREVKRQCKKAGYFSPGSIVKLSGGSVCEPARW